MQLKIKNLTKQIKNATRKWGLLILISISVTHSIWSQNITDKSMEHPQDKSQAQKDWEHIEYMKYLYNDGYEEIESYEKANLFGKWTIADKIKLNRSRLAKDFLNKYPNDPHFDRVFNLFFHVYFMPTFIQDLDKIPEEQLEYLNKFSLEYLNYVTRKQKAGVTQFSHKEAGYVFRAMPLDKKAKEQWLQYGNELVENILTSNTSMERKANASIKLISRDFLLMWDWNKYLTKETIPMETDYWEYFETYYWDSIKQRLYNLINTYPDYEGLATFIPVAFNFLKKKVSPKLARSYYEEFYLKTGDNNPLSDRAGVKALHTVLGENLKALDAIKEADGTMPLQMVFTAMDGTEVDLSKMRGKVVLIDFWSLSCGPCIKEMPHFKALYDKYRDQGFEILGIVKEGDGAKNRVHEIQKKTGANWPQRLDSGKDAPVSFHALYTITGYPTVWLLDKEGKIVDRNARGERLEPLIRKYLGLDD